MIARRGPLSEFYIADSEKVRLAFEMIPTVDRKMFNRLASLKTYAEFQLEVLPIIRDMKLEQASATRRPAKVYQVSDIPEENITDMLLAVGDYA